MEQYNFFFFMLKKQQQTITWEVSEMEQDTTHLDGCFCHGGWRRQQWSNNPTSNWEVRVGKYIEGEKDIKIYGRDMKTSLRKFSWN